MSHNSPPAPPAHAPRWVTAEQVEQTWGIPLGHLEWWGQAGCPGLPGPDRPGRKPATRREAGRLLYNAAEMEEIAAHPRLLREWRDEQGRLHLHGYAARDRFRFSVRALESWRAGCTWLGGAALTSVRALTYDPRPNFGFRRLYYYRVDELQQVQDAMAAAPRSDDWTPIRRAAALRLLGGSKHVLQQGVRLGQPALDGRTIRYRDQPRRGKTGRKVSRVRYYAREDVEAIAREREARQAQAGPDDPLTAGRAARMLGVSTCLLHYWHRHGCCHLPGGRKLPRERGRRSDREGRVRRVWLFPRAELAEIARSKGQTFGGVLQDEEGTWHTAASGERTYRHLRELTINGWRRNEHCPPLAGVARRKDPRTGKVKLRWKEVRRPQSMFGPRDTIYVYHEEDLRLASAWLAQREGDEGALRELLSNGPRHVQEVAARMAARGVSKDRLARLKTILAVESKLTGAAGSSWICSLPRTTLPGPDPGAAASGRQTVIILDVEEVRIGASNRTAIADSKRTRVGRSGQTLVRTDRLDTTEQVRPSAPATPPVDGMFTVRELAQQYGLDEAAAEALRQRLNRWCKGKLDGWEPIPNPHRGEGKRRYRLSAVRSIIEEVRRASAARPPEKKR